MSAPAPCGVLVVDKPRGPTSASICRLVKARLRRGGTAAQVKVGHAGTLDPLATGVLVVLVGRATRLSESLMSLPKRYVAEMDLSRRSTTDDEEGDVSHVDVSEPPTRARVEAACSCFVGRTMQRPPAHSAVKVGGERAYRAARRGRPTLPLPRPVVAHSIRVLEFDGTVARIEIECGRGFYVRSLARDLGEALGTGGMLRSLRRTAAGGFTLAQAREPGDLPETIGQPDLLDVPPRPDATCPLPPGGVGEG
jgi:tRNA pseudouridine55 synthase